MILDGFINLIENDNYDWVFIFGDEIVIIWSKL